MLGENVEKEKRGPGLVLATPTLISWEEGNESDKEKRGGQKGRRKFLGSDVPEAKKNFKKEGAVIGVRCSRDIKIRRSEN